MQADARRWGEDDLLRRETENVVNNITASAGFTEKQQPTGETKLQLTKWPPGGFWIPQVQHWKDPNTQTASVGSNL